MRILHVLDHSIPLQSGYSFRSRAILFQQRALGWSTYHLTGPKHSIDELNTPLQETVDGLLFYRTRAEQSLFSRIPFLNQLSVIRVLAKRLEQVADKVKPDIIHAHSPVLNGLAARTVSQKLGVPLVYEVRGFWEDAAVSHGTYKQKSLQYLIARNLETWTANRADAVICICDGIKGDLIERGVPENKITIVRNAVDPERFKVSSNDDPSLKSSLGLNTDTIIGFVGSFYAYEGLDLLLEAMPRLLSAKADVKLLLVGGGQELENLRRRAVKMGLADAIVFTGRVPHNEIERYYSLIDILCYPRLPMRLTELVTPLKPLEAMAQHKMFIASDIGGHRELLNDEDDISLFRAGNAEALASKLLFLLDNRRLWKDILDRRRNYVANKRSWEATVSCYSPVYNNLIALDPL